MRLKRRILDFLAVVTLSGVWPEVSGEDIDENIRLLKKNHWFQKLLYNEAYRKLITHNEGVRDEIGDLSTGRLKRNVHKDRYRKKVQRILEKSLKKRH